MFKGCIANLTQQIEDINKETNYKIESNGHSGA